MPSSDTDNTTAAAPADAFYRVPLTSAEVLATLAGLRALARLGAEDPALLGDLEVSVLESAVERVEAEVPDFVAGRAVALAAALASELAPPNLPGEVGDSEDGHGDPPFPVGRTRRLLEAAWGGERPVEIEYFVARRNEWTRRRVEIDRVYRDDGVWYVAGHCGLRDDYRNFRLDHVRSVRILDDTATAAAPVAAAEDAAEA